MDVRILDGALAECAALAMGGGPGLAGLSGTVADVRRGIGGPMRLAVVGQIKRGKSTLVNALLGADLAATGQLELTFTVNEFVYGDEPGITVCYRDGAREEFRAEDLHLLTVRSTEHAERLRRIVRVEYRLPNPLLKSFRLIDTPGLGSVYGHDSANTMDLLGIGGFTSPTERDEIRATLDAMGRTAEQVHEDSAVELDRADAVLYLYSRALHERDQATVESFAGPAAASITPLKAFGVLSRSDRYWPPGEDLPGAPEPLDYDPMAVAATLAEQELSRPEVGRLFYTIVPVTGLVALGARCLTGEEFGWLDELGRAGPRPLADLLSDTGWFATAPELPGIGLDAARRRRLVDRLGGWGVLRAAHHLRAGLGEDAVREALLADSGVTRLRELTVGHFGGRSTLIKLDHGLAEITEGVARARTELRRAGTPPPVQLNMIAERVERLHTHEPGFAELAVLADHYNGRLSLTAAEVDEVLAVTGEHGMTAASRLGLPADTAPKELDREVAARVEYWAARAQDPALDRRTAQAARVVCRCFERLAERVRLARRLLETDDPIDGEV